MGCEVSPRRGLLELTEICMLKCLGGGECLWASEDPRAPHDAGGREGAAEAAPGLRLKMLGL